MSSTINSSNFQVASTSAQMGRRVEAFAGEMDVASLDSIPAPQTTSTPLPSSGDIQSAVKELNDKLSNENRNLNFSIDEESGRTVVQVRDTESGEVIKQIPPEEILKIARWITDQQERSGVLLQVTS